MTIMDIKQQMYTNIQGVNKHLTKEHLDTLEWSELLCNCHPIDREWFKRKLEQAELI